ncbi:MAG: chromosome segregation protein SMC, partial [Acutalibacteraceae bacterium]
NRRPQSFAEVALTIDNSSREIAFDSDDITVTRKYYRSGDSEYRINGNTVRLKDIHEIFMDTGLGRDGYSLIGQGRISEIVGAKSNERREIFEEASGISKYRYRKEEAEKKLSAAEENLLRLNDILSELEGRIGPLKEQSEKAKKFIEFSTEKKRLEISVWVSQLGKIKEELRDHDNRILSVKTEYDVLSAELEEIDRLVEEVYDNSRKIAVDIDNLRNEISVLEEEASASQSRRAVLLNDIEHSETDLRKIEAGMDASGAQSDVIKAEMEKQAAILSELSEKKNAIDGEVHSLEASLSSLESRGGEFYREEDEISQRLSSASIGISDKAVAVASSEAALLNLSERVKELDGAISDNGETLKDLSEEKKNCEELLEGLSEKNDEYENAKNGVLSLYNMRKGKLDGLNEEKQKLTAFANEKLSKANILKELDKNMEGFGYSIKAVAKRAAEGGLRGIHGPVSKIMSVPGEYTVAIETALGAAVQNIVVENEEAAKAAIQFLKKSGQGRATFLPITSMKPYYIDEAGLDAIEGFIDTADKLVKFDKKYETVIKNLLGRVAVAEDMDSASYIANKYSYKFRIVTLDGQVINAGGSFTGGSVSKSSGILSRGAEVEKLMKAAEELKSREASFDGEIASLEEDVSS